MKTSSLTFIEDIHLNGDIFFWKTNVNLAVVLIMENIKLFWLISTRNVTERKWIDLLLYQDAIRLDKNKWSLTLAIGYPTNENCSSFYSYSISRSVEFHSGTYDQRIIDFSTFQPSIRIDRRSTWQACLLFFPSLSRWNAIELLAVWSSRRKTSLCNPNSFPILIIFARTLMIVC